MYVFYSMRLCFTQKDPVKLCCIRSRANFRIIIFGGLEWNYRPYRPLNIVGLLFRSRPSISHESVFSVTVPLRLDFFLMPKKLPP